MNKKNAMRQLDKAKISYQTLNYEIDAKDFSGENEMKMEDISKELEADEEIGKTTRIDIADIKDIEEDIREKAPEEKKELTDKSNKNDEEDSLEKDLFNLIDSMYESREDK